GNKSWLPEKGQSMDRLARFGKDVLDGWLNAEAFTLAAALAYYAIFAIAPLLLISIYIASLFFDRTSAVEGLTNELSGVVGPTGSDAIKQMLDAAGTMQPEGWAGLVGLAVLLLPLPVLSARSRMLLTRYGTRRRALPACGHS